MKHISDKLVEFDKYKGVSLESNLRSINMVTLLELVVRDKELHYKQYLNLDKTSIEFNKNIKVINMYSTKTKDINMKSTLPLIKECDLVLYKTLKTKLMYKFNYSNAYNIETVNLINEINNEIAINNLTCILHRDKYLDFNYIHNSMLLDIEKNIDIFASTITRLLYSNSIYKSTKGNLHYDLNLLSIKNIFKDKFNLLKRKYRQDIYQTDVKVFFNNETLRNINISKRLDYFKRISVIDIYKENHNMDLNNIIIRNIYKEFQKNGLRLYTNLDIQYKSYINTPLENTFTNEILLNDNKFFNKDISNIYMQNENTWIEIIKRWWWLEPSLPGDSIIIPNVDFNYSTMPELLENKNYEYIRNSSTPIDLGLRWGKDYSIPTKSISISIMVDLVNILISIWHKHSHSLSRATGKESIQFVMEILYDWYNLDISEPSFDYYRSYRWIRWEAEKVYFLYKDDTSLNGLQAIGKLISNLVDYLKQHHFNIVPIWRNPKAMDIERMFNNKYANEELIKEVAKIKGKRHFYVETENKKGDYLNG